MSEQTITDILFLYDRETGIVTIKDGYKNKELGQYNIEDFMKGAYSDPPVVDTSFWCFLNGYIYGYEQRLKGDNPPRGDKNNE